MSKIINWTVNCSVASVRGQDTGENEPNSISVVTPEWKHKVHIHTTGRQLERWWRTEPNVQTVKDSGVGRTGLSLCPLKLLKVSKHKVYPCAVFISEWMNAGVWRFTFHTQTLCFTSLSSHGINNDRVLCLKFIILSSFLKSTSDSGQKHVFISYLLIPPVDDVCLSDRKLSVFMFSFCSLTFLSLYVPVQLPWGCSDESGPQRPPDKRPHVVCVDASQSEALSLPAAGPPQPGQQEGAAPDDDAAGSRQPLVSDCEVRCGGVVSS